MSKTPSYYNVTVATTGKDDKTYFNKIGVAFPGKAGGKSFMTIKLDAVPVNGELVLFAPSAKET